MNQTNNLNASWSTTRRPPTPSPIKFSGTRLNPNRLQCVNQPPGRSVLSSINPQNAGEELYDLDKIRKSKILESRSSKLLIMQLYRLLWNCYGIIFLIPIILNSTSRYSRYDNSYGYCSYIMNTSSSHFAITYLYRVRHAKTVWRGPFLDPPPDVVSDEWKLRHGNSPLFFIRKLYNLTTYLAKRMRAFHPRLCPYVYNTASWRK
jgi:hypothetical protein